MIEELPHLILLDRDGVLNEDRVDYVKSLEELIMVAGSAAAVGRLNAAGCKIAIVTNQSCIGREVITEEQLEQIHEKIQRELTAYTGHIDKWYVAPDHPDRATARRKPGPGMMLEALEHFNVAPENAVLIGDALRDLQAAKAAGCHFILVRTGKGAALEQIGLPEELEGTPIFDDLDHAVSALLTLPSNIVDEESV